MAESIPVIGSHYDTTSNPVDNSRNKKLFVGSLDRDKTADDVLRAMKDLVPGVVNVIMYPSQQNPAQNRGYAFVEFGAHEHAVRAREELRKSPPKLWGSSQIKVDWAEPENEVDEETMSKVKILFVRKLAPETTEETLRREFEQFGQLERVKRQNDHAFVHFTERQHADVARRNKNSTVLDGCTIEVQWSKPVNKEQRLNRRTRPVYSNPLVTFPYLNGFPTHMLSGLTHLPSAPPHLENANPYVTNGLSMYRGEPLLPAMPPQVRLPTLTPAATHLGAAAFDHLQHQQQPQPPPQVATLPPQPGFLMEEPPRGGHISHQLGSAPGALRSSITTQVDTRPYPVPSAQQHLQLQQVPRPLTQYASWSPISFMASTLPLPLHGAPGPIYTNGLDFQAVGPQLASGFTLPYMPSYQPEIYGHQPFTEN